MKIPCLYITHDKMVYYMGPYYIAHDKMVYYMGPYYIAHDEMVYYIKNIILGNILL